MTEPHALAEELWNSAGDLGLGDRDRAGSSAPDLEPSRSAIPTYECRGAAAMALIQTKGHLGAGDSDFFERLLRQSRTWANDEDFWIRRSALLAHLRPLREGRGDFERFSRFADAMLEEKEFFIRKAIGWVLRDTVRTRPLMVFDWMLRRAHRASGVTMREVVKHLSPEQRNALLAAKGTWRSRAGSN